MDKTEVCRNEQNFVNVAAIGDGGDDAHLHISLTGTKDTGPRIPFRLKEPTGAEEMPQVLVVGRGNAETVVRVPHVLVKDCDVEAHAEIEMQVLGTTTDEWRFTAKLVAGDIVPDMYIWDFGDGHTLTSSTPTAEHSYRFRPQDKRYSNFLLSAAIRGRTGTIVRASRALSLSNPAFAQLVRHGKVLVLARHVGKDDEPRFELYHAYSEPVNIDHVDIRLQGSDGRGDHHAGAFPPLDVIGLDVLPPGEPTEIRVALSSVALPEQEPPLVVALELNGSTAKGLKASGVFSAVVP